MNTSFEPYAPLDVLGRKIEQGDTVAYATGGNTGTLKLARVTTIKHVPKMDGGYFKIGVVAFLEADSNGNYGDRWMSGRESWPSPSKMVIVTKYVGSIAELIAETES